MILVNFKYKDMEEKISIQREKVLNAYKHASEEQKALLESMFGKDMLKPKNIMERVKTFEDACEVLGEEHSYVQEYRGIANDNFDFTQDIIAYLKLRIICAALNEGWKPTFSDGECRYYPWFYIYNKNEYEKINKDEKKKCHVISRSSYDAYAFGGVVFSSLNISTSYSYSYHGSQIVFKTRELAEYCEKQFIDIWVDYLFR